MEEIVDTGACSSEECDLDRVRSGQWMRWSAEASALGTASVALRVITSLAAKDAEDTMKTGGEEGEIDDKCSDQRITPVPDTSRQAPALCHRIVST